MEQIIPYLFRLKNSLEFIIFQQLPAILWYNGCIKLHLGRIIEMYQLNNLFNNNNMKVIANKGNFQVFEHERDLSVSPADAVTAYFSSEMNVRKRQVLANLNGNSVTIQAGAMQWMLGNVQASSGVKGVGNFLGKMVSSAVTGESVAKPVYSGEGLLMLEPTYKHII